MTVGELKQILEGIDNLVPVCITWDDTSAEYSCGGVRYVKGMKVVEDVVIEEPRVLMLMDKQ